ncbi:phosphoglycolate phosphatase [Tepiditoga spiralis]|uniref:Phosphoglycolate phosphatase n=1 Tax=Tepiditoga spiralis TaxID=2108365 RepID=A0A7G1G3M3_9BACT|nr:HAD hydrolase-like protein [Tepiditoga spiralis]BBE30625.1 phosphoglycolate phosphatase [Tepiditoga spiralis]
MSYKYLFFDMDGTLFDTSEGIIYSMKKAYELNNLKPLEENEIIKLIGPTLDEIMNMLFKEDSKLKIKVRNDFRQIYASKGVFKLQLFPKVIKTLEILFKRNKKMYIITSKPSIFAEQIIEKFNMSKYFQKIFGVPLEGKIPSKSKRLKYLIRELNIPVKESIIIGDTESDINAGKYNNMDIICVKFGFCKNHEYLKNSCSYIINSFDDIFNIVGE